MTVSSLRTWVLLDPPSPMELSHPQPFRFCQITVLSDRDIHGRAGSERLPSKHSESSSMRLIDCFGYYMLRITPS